MFKFNVLMNGLCRHAEGVSDQDYSDMLRGESGRMMLESVTLEEIEATYLYGRELMFEAITTTNKRVERTMAAFQRQLNRQLAGSELEAEAAEIGSPRTAGGFATLTARFPISDGQAVSIIFHSPSGDPKKITADDTLVAFRFLMNKRDITNVVAPAGGQDISLKLVTTKLSNLLERNSEKFQLRNAEVKAQNDELEALQAAIEATAKAVEEQLQADAAITQEVADASADIKAQQQVLSNLQTRVKDMRDYLAKLKAEAAEKAKTIKPEGGDNLPENFVSDKIKKLVADMSLSEFQRYAKDNLSMNAADAEKLYLDADEQIGRDIEASIQEEHDELVKNDPHNMLMASLADALKAKLGQGMAVSLRPDKKYPMVKVELNGGLQRLDISAFKGDSEYHVSVDFIHDTERGYSTVEAYPKIPLAYEGRHIEQIANEVAAICEENTSTLVDVSNLPAYGSRVDEGLSTKDIAKELRQAITAAKKAGKLPKDMKISVTAPSGGVYSEAIRASIVEVGGVAQMYSKQWLEFLAKKSRHEIEEDRAYRGSRYSPDVTAAKAWLDAHIYAHYYNRSDSMTDYFDYAFSFNGTEVVDDYERQETELANHKINTSGRNAKMFDYDAVKAIAATMLSREFIAYMAKEYNTRETDAKAIWDTAMAEMDQEANNKLADGLKAQENKDGTGAANVSGHWYGLQARPYSIGTVPESPLDYLSTERALARWPHLKGASAIRHGAVMYAEPLTPAQVSQFELAANLNLLNAKRSPELADYDANDIASQYLRAALDNTYDLTRASVQEVINGGAKAVEKWLKDAIKTLDLFKERKENPDDWKELMDRHDQIIKTPELLFDILKDDLKEDATVPTANVQDVDDSDSDKPQYDYSAVSAIAKTMSRSEFAKYMRKTYGVDDRAALPIWNFAQSDKKLGGDEDPSADNQEPSAKQVAIDTLQDLLDSDDVEKLQNALDDLLDIVEADGTEDEHGDLLDAAQDKIVALLEVM